MSAADDEALEWLVRLNDIRVEAAARRDFAHWLERPGNAEAWDRAQALWIRLSPVTQEMGRQRRMTRRAALAIGAAALLAPALLWSTRSGRFADYRTAAGETRHLALPDGSTVDLAAGSALSLAYGSSRRGLTLHVGEAFFQVAPDPQRPFVVRAGAGEVAALGTAFNIRLTGEDVSVSVTEHAVRARSDGAGERVVSAGQRLVYGPAGPGTVQTIPTDQATSWRQGAFVFQGATLGEVMDVLGRNAGWTVVITEPARRLPVTAMFHQAQLDQAPETIARTLPVRVTRLPGDIVVLRLR
ncbi:FecR domain-containing protein [Frigidibacter sp.]|uniref:FecR family protein n=1 Tax=Frigidibacter sp. TaxID=2586418 RepID=UPI0027330CF9|nr:FecR domain-containing protein [Frigidibacter sp.]MDP3339323.1 FecR domain-containing protein [Frigidibacter sp.]